MSEPAKKYTCWGIQLCSGGAGYGLLEILWRGYTHVSMLIAGGFCFWLIIRIAKSESCLLFKSLLGGMVITFVEFISGCVVNLWMKLAVWDYSGEICHLLGQICLRYTMLWTALCAVAIPLCCGIMRLHARKYFKSCCLPRIRIISRMLLKENTRL